MIDSDKSVGLYRSIKDGNRERVFKHWHASSISDCPRAHYFKRLGLSPLQQPTGAKILRWNAGHYLEKGIRPHIEKLYKGVGSNRRLTSEAWDLTGEYDNYAEGDRALIEVKSVSDYAFYKEGERLGLKQRDPQTGRYRLKDGPYLHHELQQHCYVLLLEELGSPVAKIDYVYLSLSGRIVVFSTEPNPLLLAAVKRRLTLLNEAWAAREPPACVCSEDSPLWGPVLQWCDFRAAEGGCCDLGLIRQELPA